MKDYFGKELHVGDVCVVVGSGCYRGSIVQHCIEKFGIFEVSGMSEAKNAIGEGTYGATSVEQRVYPGHLVKIGVIW